MDNLVSEINRIERKVSITDKNIYDLHSLFFVQIAAYYAEQNYDDFAVVIQPFVSNAKSDKFSIDYLSNVRHYTIMQLNTAL